MGLRCEPLQRLRQILRIFRTISVNFATGTFSPLIPGAIYQIATATGHATIVALTETTLSAIVNMNDTMEGAAFSRSITR